jgi:hypothetical protein
MAPLCFSLAARKKLTVRHALASGRWMKGLQNINSEAQLDQFIELWTRLQQVELVQDQQDTITWILTADDKYSARSAYEVQFYGRIKLPSLQFVWQTKAEGKVQSFLWLLLQNRKWTAERLSARGLPHDDYCCFCDQEFETARHLVLQCPFAREVWSLFRTSDSFLERTAAQSLTVCGWWNKIRRGQITNQRKKNIALSMYIMWHLWKERCQRIFENEFLTAPALSSLIRADLDLVLIAKSVNTEM